MEQTPRQPKSFLFQTNQCRGSFFSVGNGKRNYHATDLFEGDPETRVQQQPRLCKLTYGRPALDNAEVGLMAFH